MKRLLITGARGNLGRILRGRLDHIAGTVRLSDREPVGDPRANEEDRPCELSDLEAVRALVDGCEGIVHLGGQAVEAPFETILQSNLIGLYNVYEAARKAGTRRIVFASSNHAIGYHHRGTKLGPDAPIRPDSLYGVSKCFGEAVARLYHDKFGIESALVRIGSCFEKPADHRQLATWLSPDDFVRLIERAFAAPWLGCPIVYGASDNAERWWDNAHADYLGWRPADTAEVFRAEIERTIPTPARDDPAVIHQGGAFAAAGHPED